MARLTRGKSRWPRPGWGPWFAVIWSLTTWVGTSRWQNIAACVERRVRQSSDVQKRGGAGAISGFSPAVKLRTVSVADDDDTRMDSPNASTRKSSFAVRRPTAPPADTSASDVGGSSWAGRRVTLLSALRYVSSDRVGREMRPVRLSFIRTRTCCSALCGTSCHLALAAGKPTARHGSLLSGYLWRHHHHCWTPDCLSTVFFN